MNSAYHLPNGKLTTREKQILAGLYLSKYDALGLTELGFDSFAEAFNVVGYGLGSRPASIKNYRDEFDPLFPNERRGWHKRPTRDYCFRIFENYKDLDFKTFTALVRSFFRYDGSAEQTMSREEEQDEAGSSFAQRLITGLAAEHYFQEAQPKIPEFRGYLVENTTRFGCGYDFRLRARPDASEYLAVEVKGLKDRTGSVAMTTKEHQMADTLRERFFLFIVSNFREAPSHALFQNPLYGQLHFKKTERVVLQVSWMTTV